VRHRVVVTRPELPGTGIARLAGSADVEVSVRQSHDPTTAEELRRLVAGAAAVVATGMDRFDAGALDAADRLRVLATTSVGVDHIDLAAASARDVVVTNTPDVLVESCADHAFGLLLAARRRIAETDRAVRAGAWRRHTMHDWLGEDVHGRQLGLIGFGAIAAAVARRARGFAMDVVHHDRSHSTSHHSRWVPLDELLRTSDIVSLHVPLTAETEHLIDARALALMRPTATLVNTARGAVVDTGALIAALRAGRLQSAGLDVVEGEPMSDPSHPLLALDNVVVTPHAASATLTARSAMVDRAIDNVLAVLRGRQAPDRVAAFPDAQAGR